MKVCLLLFELCCLVFVTCSLVGACKSSGRSGSSSSHSGFNRWSSSGLSSGVKSFSSSSSSRSAQLSYDHNAREMRQILGTNIRSMQRFERPLSSSGSDGSSRAAAALGARHSGVVATLENGEQFLIHKVYTFRMHTVILHGISTHYLFFILTSRK